MSRRVDEVSPGGSPLSSPPGFGMGAPNRGEGAPHAREVMRVWSAALRLAWPNLGLGVTLVFAGTRAGWNSGSASCLLWLRYGGLFVGLLVWV